MSVAQDRPLIYVFYLCLPWLVVGTDVIAVNIMFVFPGIRMQWSNSGEVLAVGGFVRLPNLKCRNELRFYSRTAQLRCSLEIPQQVSRVACSFKIKTHAWCELGMHLHLLVLTPTCTCTCLYLHQLLTPACTYTYWYLFVLTPACTYFYFHLLVLPPICTPPTCTSVSTCTYLYLHLLMLNCWRNFLDDTPWTSFHLFIKMRKNFDNSTKSRTEGVAAGWLLLQGKPITSLTWGHNDKRLFLAMGCHIRTVWITKKVASLQFLCRHCIQSHARDEAGIQRLPLPSKLRANVSALYSPTIKVWG